MQRPIFTNVQPAELPALYRGVYFTWLGRFFATTLLFMLVLSPLDTSYAADEDTVSSTETVPEETKDPNEDEQNVTESEVVFDESVDNLVVTEPEQTASDTTEPEMGSEDQSDDADTEVLPDEETSASSSETEAEANTDTEDTATSTAEDSERSTTTSTSTVASTTPTVAGTSTAATTTSTTTTSSTSTSTESSTNELEATSTPATEETERTTEADIDTNTYDDTVTTEDSQSSESEEQRSDPNTEAVSDTEPVTETDTSPESVATTTAKENVSEATVTNDQNRHQFADSECVAVADGSYYCQKTDATEVANTGTVVLAKLDASGYSNIYIQDGDSMRPLTDNNYEDLAPHYDPISETVVWHRSIDDVFQIISYDLETKRETQVTTSATNNMQPVQSGDVLVWQAWVDGAWQIVLKDGGSAAKQLTKSGTNNIAPYVSGGYVIWNVTIPDQPREVAVYELATGNLSYIEDPDGGQVTNPRFVLMYDTKFDNGDTVTKGFDPETGQLVPLGAVPAPTAPDIPSSDPVGETRALLQNKTNEEEADGLEIHIEPDSSPGTTSTSSAATTTSSSTVSETMESDYTLAIPATSTATSTDDTSTTSTSSELSEYDLPIAPYGTTTETMASGTDRSDAATSSATSTQADDS